jgi:hypothetical protein
MIQMAQTGGSPYDEEAYMPGGPPPTSSVNRFLDNRLMQRYPGAGRFVEDYEFDRRIPHMSRGAQPPPGSDSDMMMIYGPEDQVAYDQQGNPIRLDDPRHPRNQRQMPGLNPMLQPSYPQRR